MIIRKKPSIANTRFQPKARLSWHIRKKPTIAGPHHKKGLPTVVRWPSSSPSSSQPCSSSKQANPRLHFLLLFSPTPATQACTPHILHTHYWALIVKTHSRPGHRNDNTCAATSPVYCVVVVRTSSNAPGDGGVVTSKGWCTRWRRPGLRLADAPACGGRVNIGGVALRFSFIIIIIILLTAVHRDTKPSVEYVWFYLFLVAVCSVCYRVCAGMCTSEPGGRQAQEGGYRGRCGM